MKTLFVILALLASAHMAHAHGNKTCHAHGTHHHCK